MYLRVNWGPESKQTMQNRTLLLLSLLFAATAASIPTPTAFEDALVPLDGDDDEAPLALISLDSKHGFRPHCCGCPTTTGKNRVRILSQQYITDLLAARFPQAYALQSPLMPAPELIVKCVGSAGCCVDGEVMGMEAFWGIGRGAYQISPVRNVKEYRDGSVGAEASIGIYLATGAILAVTLKMRWAWEAGCQLKLINLALVDVPCGPGTASATTGCAPTCYVALEDATSTVTNTLTTITIEYYTPAKRAHEPFATK